MSVMILRTTIKPEAVEEARAAVETLFAALHEAKPQGINYASYVAADGASYTVVLEVEDGVENPLPGIPAFGEFQKALGGFLAGPPAPEQLTVVGQYRS